MRWIYISPHFDDAILSCGGLIWEQTHQGIAVEIWTVCAGDPPPGPLSPLALDCHRKWGIGTAEEMVALRRVEDRHACQAVHAAWRHFTIPDCIYRRSPQGDPLYPETLSAPLHPLDADLDREIAGALRREIGANDRLVCPLAIGGHVDHVLTRRAVERLGRPLGYYADIPYLLNHPESLAEARVGLRLRVQAISKDGLQAWQAASAAYASQIGVQFGSWEKMRAALRQYCQNRAGVGLWRKG